MSKQSLNLTNKLNILLENTGDMALKRRARKIIETLAPENGDNILEVGCGDGFYLHLLSNINIKSLKLTGIDIDDNALVSARRNLSGKKVKLLKGDVMMRLPFKSNTFDKVVMSEVCEHLPDDIKGLREVRRVLKKDGRLIVTVPNHNYPFLWDPINWILEHLFNTHIKSGFWSGLWNQHLRLYKPQEIARSIKKAGFRVEDVKAMTWWCIPFNHNLLYLAARTLHAGGFSSKVSGSVNKFKNNRGVKIIDLVFKFVNTFDKVNDLYQPKNIGVGIYIKASK